MDGLRLIMIMHRTYGHGNSGLWLGTTETNQINLAAPVPAGIIDAFRSPP